jgi:cyclophilin family peptidyl-prolyl cis-trans isomerase
MKTKLVIGWVVGLPAVATAVGCGEPAAATRTLEHLSPVYTVDQEYRSMKGPSSLQTVQFPEADSKELLWITGYHAVMVGADGETPMSQEYMCHSNLDFDPIRHAKLFDQPVYHTGRLFTLSQGQFDIQLPEGFGLPYYADEELSLATQVLNLNPDGQTREVRHRISIDYVMDGEVAEDEPMKPLFMTSGWGMVLLEGDSGHFGVSSPDMDHHGDSCLPGQTAGADLYKDEFGREFSGHWVVKPGREENKTLVTEIMKIPYDTTVHYIAVHLHPFAESLELVDLTDGKSIFKSNVTNSRGKIGLDHVEYFSSVEGVPVYADHEYQMVSIYDNPTDVDQDSMAVMLLYLHDKQWKKPEARPVEIPVTKIARPLTHADETIVLHTSMGDVRIALYDKAAPNHTARMLKLAQLGVFDGMPFIRVEEDFLVQTGFPVKLNAEQQAAVTPLQAEFNDVGHKRGIVSMALNDNENPHSAEASFFILLDEAYWLDGQYTVIGEVVSGLEVVEAMSRQAADSQQPREPIKIESAEVVAR